MALSDILLLAVIASSLVLAGYALTGHVEGPTIEQSSPPRPSGPTRLLIVAIGAAIALWFLLPEYRRSASEIRQQFRDIDARRKAGNDLAGRQIIHCDSDWLGHFHCDGDAQ